MELSAEDRDPRLTVVIPAWNAASSIEHSVRSVLAERSVALECLVIDDGSTDGTFDVVARLQAEDPRVVPIRLAENGGVSNARNVGLEAARGEWLAFHDADDRMLPGGIAVLMGATADPEVRAVIGQRVWSDGRRTWLSPLYDIPDIRLPGRKSIATNPGLLFYAAVTGKAFHRSLIDGLEFEGRVLGDQPWTIRALLRAGDGIEVIDDTVFEWRRPADDGPVEGITARSRASARAATQIARMAVVAFGQVADEVDRTIDDEATRTAIKLAYFDRLVRSDLGGRVALAVRHGDQETAWLIDAITDFLLSIPPPILSGGETALTLVLRPPARRWLTLGAAARSAYWRMVDSVAEADPGILRRMRVRLVMKPAFLLAARRSPVARTVADAYLSLLGIPLAMVDRVHPS